MNISEKLENRKVYVRLAFAFMMLIPVGALGLILLGVDPSPAEGIFATSAATFSAIIIAHFATTPKES